MFGELHLEGFEVSHTKDGFRWNDEDEQPFLELLREHLDSNDFPLLRQADNYRVLASRRDRDAYKMRKRWRWGDAVSRSAQVNETSE